jgi:hypothetical protein
MDWVQFKDYLSQVSDLSQDARHIYAAVAGPDGRGRSAAPVAGASAAGACLLAVLAVNEAIDLAERGKPIEEWQVLGGLRGVWNTLLLPTALMLLARLTPGL